MAYGPRNSVRWRIESPSGSVPAPSPAQKTKNLCERGYLPRRIADPNCHSAALSRLDIWTSLRSSHVRRSSKYERVGRLRDSPITLSKKHGARMLVYLFRDESSRDTFAYSTDVTGRNIAGTSPRAKWHYVAIDRTRDLDNHEEVTRHLRQRGYYIFRKSRAT
jgi:hypothetical protein